MAESSIYDLQDAIKVDESSNQLQLIDAIHERLSQVRAQLFAISTGDGLEHFETFSVEYKGYYLWALERKVDEIDVLFDLFCDVSQFDVMSKDRV